MTRRIHVFDTPERFVCGTVGPPGQRTFFLQAVQGPRIVSVQLEKVQVAVLADRIGQILMELQRRGVAAAVVAEPAGDDERPLDEPLRDEFRVETLTIAWDSDQDEIVVEARSENEAETEEEADEIPELADDAEEGPDVVRVRLAPGQAVGFVRRSARVLAAGRPPCPFCGQPLNPEGHICPRSNGYLN
jgi:uncharacterized repeat protein (TIGR03847 family)